MQSVSIGIDIPQLPQKLEDGARYDWFMDRFGKTIGMELAYRLYIMLDDLKAEKSQAYGITLTLDTLPSGEPV